MNEQEAYEAWFRGEQGKPYDGAYTFAEAAWHAALAWLRSQGEPVFWVRLTSDGGYEGPIHNDAIERVRRLSGAWHPLFLAPQPAIPDGWKLVPMEPTEEMLRSAFCEAGGSYENTKGIYRAMLATAPEPSK